MQDKRWDLNPRQKVTVGTRTQGRLEVKGEELSKERTLSEAQVMVYGPEFTRETKSEATLALSYSIYTSTIKSSHRELTRRVS